MVSNPTRQSSARPNQTPISNTGTQTPDVRDSPEPSRDNNSDNHPIVGTNATTRALRTSITQVDERTTQVEATVTKIHEVVSRQLSSLSQDVKELSQRHSRQRHAPSEADLDTLLAQIASLGERLDTVSVLQDSAQDRMAQVMTRLAAQSTSAHAQSMERIDELAAAIQLLSQHPQHPLQYPGYTAQQLAATSLPPPQPQPPADLREAGPSTRKRGRSPSTYSPPSLPSSKLQKTGPPPTDICITGVGWSSPPDSDADRALFATIVTDITTENVEIRGVIPRVAINIWKREEDTTRCIRFRTELMANTFIEYFPATAARLFKDAIAYPASSHEYLIRSRHPSTRFLRPTNADLSVPPSQQYPPSAQSLPAFPSQPQYSLATTTQVSAPPPQLTAHALPPPPHLMRPAGLLTNAGSVPSASTVSTPASVPTRDPMQAIMDELADISRSLKGKGRADPQDSLDF